MRYLLVSAILLLAGCFQVTKPPPPTAIAEEKRSVEIPGEVLEACSIEYPKLVSGAEADVLIFIKEFVSLYKECRSKHLKATGLLCKAVNCQTPKE